VSTDLLSATRLWMVGTAQVRLCPPYESDAPQILIQLSNSVLVIEPHARLWIASAFAEASADKSLHSQ